MSSDDHFDTGDSDSDSEFTPITDPVLRRQATIKNFRIALADFRLGRANLLWPCVAMVVDAAFTLIDPAGVQFLGDDPDACTEYEAVAAMVWNEVCMTMFGSLCDDSGELAPEVDEDGKAWATISRDEIHRIVLEVLSDEFGPVPDCGSQGGTDDNPTLFDGLDSGDRGDEAGPAEDDQHEMWRSFADIVAREFDEQVGSSEVPADTVAMTTGVQVRTVDPLGFVDPKYIDQVADLIHGRLGCFPMGRPGRAD